MNPDRSLRARTGLSLAALTLAVSTVALTPAPAQALNQYCGKDAVGVGVNYAAGSLDNGHPDPDSDRKRWGGLGAVQKAQSVEFAVQQARGYLDVTLKIAKAFDDEPARIPAFVLSIVGYVLQATETAASIAVMTLEQGNARVNACGGTLGADMTDLLFIGELEAELATLDPDGVPSTPDGSPLPRGVRVAGSGMFLLPDDGLPSWQTYAGRYGDREGHADLGLFYQEGFLNAPDIGVAEVVRDEIAHLEAHGIATGKPPYYDARLRRTVTPPGAKEQWATAMTHMKAGDLKRAYREFARAYQTAVETPDLP